MTAWAIGLLVLVGAFFVVRTPSAATDGTVAAAPAAAGPVSDERVGGSSATKEAVCKTGAR